MRGRSVRYIQNKHVDDRLYFWGPSLFRGSVEKMCYRMTEEGWFSESETQKIMHSFL